MTISGQIFNFVVNLIGSSGYLGILVLMILEGATLPIPSEIILPFAGYLVFQGKLNFWPVAIVATIGALIGTTIDYSIGYYLGRAAILRYGQYIRLNENHLKTSERWFARHGDVTVLLCQFVPLIRTVVAFPAGIAEMRVWRFLLYAAIGTSVWNTVLVYVGFVAGANSTAIINTLSRDFTYVEVVAVAIIIVFFAAWLSRRRLGTRASTRAPV